MRELVEGIKALRARDQVVEARKGVRAALDHLAHTLSDEKPCEAVKQNGSNGHGAVSLFPVRAK